MSRNHLRITTLAISLLAICLLAAGCGGGAGTTDPEQSCDWIVGSGTSGANGIVTIDMGELGTFSARVRDGLTSEPLAGAEYICVANGCKDMVSCFVMGGTGYQTTVFTYDRQDVVTEGGGVPGFWDDLFPWVGGESPMPGVHAVVSVPEVTWNELRSAVTEQATDEVEDLEDGSIATALTARLSGLLLATTYPTDSNSVLVYVCYCDPADPGTTLAELKDGVYLAQGYCSTQQVRLVEVGGPTASRTALGIDLLEPVNSEPECVPTQNLASLYGVVRDATTGEGLADASVSVNGAPTTSDAIGNWSVSGVIPGDNVLITAMANGYQPFALTLAVGSGANVEQDLVLVPAAVYGDQYRFVLTWGENPSDLDSHLWVPQGQNHYHVAFWDKGSLTGEPYAELDVDDVFSFGPETVTLLPEHEGEYVYAVHEWTGDGTLATSAARVQLYAGNTLVRVLDVPQESCGENWWWYVGDLNAETGEFTVVDRLQADPPLEYWRGAPTTKGLPE
jgi:hypothetical protein